jgi:ornithine cyclodeaminase/alanine dehydrogenase-like protein (mu-crystallin family)
MTVDHDTLRVFDHDDVVRYLPMAECIELMQRVFITLARGGALLPLRQVVWQPDRTGALGVMPAYLDDPGVIGAKVITVFPGNRGTPYESHQGSVLLFECEYGRPLAIVDASAITAIRTAAVSALATRAMAPENAGDLAILGTGTQAVVHLEAMRAVRPVSRVRVWSRTLENARRFAITQSERHGIEVIAAGSAREAVDGAAIICTVTSAAEPVLEGAWIAPGSHVNAVGASTPAFRELDMRAIERSRVVVDRRESALNEAADILIPLREGRITEDHILAELGEVLAENRRIRTADDDITLFRSLGLAIEDLAAAYHVYRAASAFSEEV